MTALARTIQTLDDRTNPIVVKELRQAVTGRFLMAVLLVFLIVQLFTLGVFLLSTEGVGDDMDGGRTVFLWLRALMLGTCLLFVPAYTAIRLTGERSNTNVDLLFVTTLPSRAIVWGKFLSAMVVVIMVYSACTPFLSLTYLLRGIDLPTIFILLGMDLMVVAACVMLALFLACIPANRALRSLLWLGGLGALLAAYSAVTSWGWNVVTFGLGGTIGSADFWIGVAMLVGEFAAGMGLLYLVSVAIISPPSANRALPVRLYMTILWLAIAAAAFGATVYYGTHAPVAGWVFQATPILLLAVLITISERDDWGPRIARSIPKNRLLRPFAFLLYSGNAGGSLWAVLMLALTLGGAWFWAEQGLYASSGFGTGALFDVLDIFIPLSLYVVAYGLTALLIRRTPLRDALPPSSTYALALVLMAVGTIAPFVLALLVSRSPWYELSRDWFITVPFIVFDTNEDHPEAWWFSGIWAGVGRPGPRLGRHLGRRDDPVVHPVVDQPLRPLLSPGQNRPRADRHHLRRSRRRGRHRPRRPGCMKPSPHRRARE